MSRDRSVKQNGSPVQGRVSDPAAILQDTTLATGETLTSTIEATEEDPLLPRDGVHHSTADDEGKPDISVLRGVVIAASMGFLLFLQTTNISMLTTTTSAIASDLDAFESTSWFISAYLVPASSLSPLTGRLSQIFSPRIIMFGASLIFCIGSIITAFADSFPGFIFGRVIVGIAASGIFPTATIIVLDLVRAKRRGLFIGLLNSSYTAGIAVSAAIGGALEPTIGWRALFWIQAPVAFVAGLGVFFGIKRSFTSAREAQEFTFSQKLRSVDWAGALTLTASLALLLYGLASAQIALIPIIISIFIFPAFVLSEIYLAKHPIIPVTLLKSRGLLMTCLATLGFMMARYVVLFYTPIYGIAVRLDSAGGSGSLLIPTNTGFALGGLVTGLLHIRRAGSFYFPCVVVTLLFPLSELILGYISTPDSSLAAYIVFVFINGFLAGAQINYALAHVLHLTDPSTHFIVTALIGTFRGFSGSFGSAVGGGVFVRTLKTALNERFGDAGLLPEKQDLLRRLVGSPALVAKLNGKEQEMAVASYEHAIFVLFIAGVILSAAMVFVQAATGWNAPGDKEKDQENGTTADTES